MKMKIKKFNEDFDPMIGIDNFLNNPLTLALVTSWILSGKMKLSNLDDNIKSLKNDFIYYANALGYQIDSGMLDMADFKFKQLLKKAKNILKK